MDSVVWSPTFAFASVSIETCFHKDIYTYIASYLEKGAEFMANLTDLSNISSVASTTEAHAADECPGGNGRGGCGGLEQNDNGCH